MTNPLYDALIAPHAGRYEPFILRQGQDAFSYADFVKRVAQTANALTASGLGAGDRLAIQASKSVGVLEIYAACIQTGVIFLPLNTAYTDAEIDYFLSDAEPALFICDPDRANGLIDITGKHDTQILTLGANENGSFADLVVTQPESAPVADRSAEDIAALLYTSGTTGRSKGAMLTQGNLLSNAEVLIREWRITKADRLLHALPVFHAHGLFVAVNTSLLAGAQLIYLPAFVVDDVLVAMPKATTMMGVPTFYTRLLDDARFTHDVASHMRLFISGSAPLLAETHKAFEARTGHRILERYGMTETGMNTTNPYDQERRAGTVGFALPGTEIRITDGVADGPVHEVAPGKVGMIEVRGPNVFSGYWRMPEKTAEEVRDDGFFITGDLGMIDTDGYIHIVGRDKDLIISGGYNVYPKEVELVLDEVEGVEESAVFGVPHPDFGEGVVAAIVASSGKAPDLTSIKAHAATSLAKFKQPKEIVLLDALPRNTMGKVQKNVLRDTHARLFARQAAG